MTLSCYSEGFFTLYLPLAIWRLDLGIGAIVAFHVFSPFGNLMLKWRWSKAFICQEKTKGSFQRQVCRYIVFLMFLSYSSSWYSICVVVPSSNFQVPVPQWYKGTSIHSPILNLKVIINHHVLFSVYQLKCLNWPVYTINLPPMFLSSLVEYKWHLWVIDHWFRSFRASYPYGCFLLL